MSYSGSVYTRDGDTTYDFSSASSTVALLKDSIAIQIKFVEHIESLTNTITTLEKKVKSQASYMDYCHANERREMVVNRERVEMITKLKLEIEELKRRSVDAQAEALHAKSRREKNGQMEKAEQVEKEVVDSTDKIHQHESNRGDEKCIQHFEVMTHGRVEYQESEYEEDDMDDWGLERHHSRFT